MRLDLKWIARNKPKVKLTSVTEADEESSVHDRHGSVPVAKHDHEHGAQGHRPHGKVERLGHLWRLFEAEDQ